MSVSKVGNMDMKSGISIVYNVARAEAYLRTRWHLDPSSCLATTARHRTKRGGDDVPLSGRGSWVQSNTIWPGPRPTSVLSHSPKRHLDQ